MKNFTLKKDLRKIIRRIREIVYWLDIKQIIHCASFPIIYLISLFCKPFCKNIWIIGENPSEACDNGYVFFKYIRENRTDINAYYVIKKQSKDYSKVEKYGNIIQYRSLKHWIYYLNAKKIIVTQKYANPSPALFYVLHNTNIMKIPRVFLQHGIIINDCKMFYYKKTNFRLFICGAKREYEYIKENFGYPSENVVYTGLARFDNLDISKRSKNNLILITPTWRNYIRDQKQFDDFMENYYKLLNNHDLIKFIEANDIKLQVVLHKNMQKFVIIKNTLSKNISMNHNREVDIQELINKTDLLITDFSSVSMDVAYRKKPILYYQFDNKDFREKQLSEGYFSYENDGFGDVVENQDLLIDKIKYYIEHNFELEDKYKKRTEDFFERRDMNNCQRILEEIEKI